MASTELSIDQAAAEFKENIDKFVEAYKEKHRQNPEQYPLVLGSNNSGLWNEFMLDYHLNGTV